MAAEHDRLIEKLALAPNVFDDFVKIDELTLQTQAEKWRLELVETVAVSERAQDRLRQLDDALGSLEEQLGQERKSKVELELQCQQLATSLNEVQSALARSENDVRMLWPLAQEVAALRRLPDEVQELERRLHALTVSFSWRITGPLRRVSRKFPFVAHALRDFFVRHPRLKRLIIATARKISRRASPPPAIAQQAEAHQTLTRTMAPKNLAALQRLDAVNWFFLGDTIEWLEARPQLSGVGKVTIELFCAAHESHALPRLRACAVAPNALGLAALDEHGLLAYLARRCGAAQKLSPPKATLAHSAPKTTDEMPAPGDHILFTGVVWTDHHTNLFHSLADASIRFSVFVYDIIPILNPEFVDAATIPPFERWMRALLVYADCVFVSSATIKDQLLRWATLSNVYVNAKIFSVGFGTSALAQAEGLPLGPALSRVRAENFVLCVGTIDHRKNQALLCHIWPRLLAELGCAQTPQLVLVGHDHIGLAGDPSTQAALQKGDILVLEGISDSDVAALYAACQFTAFPSLSEGYGLPVSESLAFSKVCVASDLPVIRDHAGDLPWYFPAGDETAAYAQLRRAITDLPAREAAESLIAASYRHHRWVDTYVAMTAHIAELRRAPIVEALAQPEEPVIPGFSPPPVRATIAAAQRWCTHDNPDVSFLIINWRAAELTRACIEHIWASTSDVTYEIIIVDNGSPETDLRALSDLGSGVRLVPLGVNCFFGEACNIAAEHARGRHLCLLNNDCFGEAGWLPRLVRILDTEPSVGAAGPLFLFPDRSVQEAGGVINEDGIPVRFGRGDKLVEGETPDYLVERSVDYISAAALVISREVYWRAGGFDLGFEPAYYEDADLCLKLRTLGLSVRFCPDARAVHIEGAAANHDPAAEARRRVMGDLNRAKFLNRWGRFLQDRKEASLNKIAAEIFCDVQLPIVQRGKPEAVIYTPYALTPGGGERFLLTIASILMPSYDVCIVTPNPYSRLRLLNIGFEFGLDLSSCSLQTEEAFLAAPAPALMITVGNHVVPPIEPRAANSFFICQFPFPMDQAVVPDVSKWAHGYRRVIAYSEYAKAHILAAQNTHRMPHWPVEVVYPAVPQHAGAAADKKPFVLTVGRFFAGGHNKRHDLMIAAFRDLRDSFKGDLEMHIVGSSLPDPVHMKYLDDLFASAKDLPVTFHVNASPETLNSLYRDAAVYWHATGLGADLKGDPSMAEHFGISLAEAMSAECVPLAFDAGGPREIVTRGENGYLYHSKDELVQRTRYILQAENEPERRAMAQAAGRRAREFAPEIFRKRIWDVLHES